MMELLKMCGISACGAALAGTIINLLSPKGNMEKVLNFCVSIFFICVVIYPILRVKDVSFDNLNVFFDKEVKEYSQDFEVTKENLEKKEIETVLKGLISKKLAENNITYNKILFFYNTTEDNCISIYQIDVFVDKNINEKANDIKKSIEQDIGQNINIILE
ncbi:MAG: stage III sporulation protein AF [Oscillospiraceae bacterium]|nr:stage III sporulation protein AF [Oscillospiraceae bacterium]